MKFLGFRPENIPMSICRLRSDGMTPSINQHFDGGQCRVFKADFPSGPSWAIRIPLFMHHREAISSVIQGEAEVLQELNIKGFCWAAKLQGYSATFDNEIGFPFIALTWIPGTPLSWSESLPMRPLRDKILAQIALIQKDLIECTKLPSMLGACIYYGLNLLTKAGISAVEHFERIIDNKIHRVRNGLLPELTEQDCVDQKNRLPQALYEKFIHASFAIDHGDLSPQNILVDLNNNITGIIDWGFSARVPVQLAAGFPRLLRLKTLLLPPSAVLRKDRESYLKSLQSQSSQAGYWMVYIQSAKDADFRLCFLESVISKGMHRHLAALRWKLPHRDDNTE